MNREKQRKTYTSNPYVKASIPSKLTFWWLRPIFTIGLKRAIRENDIYAVVNAMRSDLNTEAFAKLWEVECKKEKPSLFRIMLKMYLGKLIVCGFLMLLCHAIIRSVEPICLGRLIAYFSQGEHQTITLTEAYGYATGIILSTAMFSIVKRPFTFFASNLSCKMRAACSGLIYKKTLKILKSSAEDGQNGKIINILANDMVRFDMAFISFPNLFGGPLFTIIFLFAIYMEIGVAGIIGVASLFSVAPLQVWLGKRSGNLRSKCAKRTDFRVKIMNEILHGIQVIKMYAWEKSFAKVIAEIRKKEVAKIRSIAYIIAIIHSSSLISKFSLFFTFVSYILFGNAITASKVYMISSYFSTLEFSMLTLWPEALVDTAQALVTIDRIQEFLLRPESKLPRNNDKTKQIVPQKMQMETQQLLLNKNTGHRIENINSADKLIRLENATAVWEHSDGHQMNGIFNVNVEMRTGLCAIVGAVGSCKSTLLNVILGELDLDAGSITINGSISYAAQEPWLFEDSVRNNIVFVEEFDEQRYRKVVDVCALERDFKLLPQGDATIVGEKGSSLSGGQKARVNLARAIYKRSDIYLLDDPLSAVDTHVGKHIFERCIEKFLADKICVLVTHQLQYLKNVEHVILMKGGRVEAEGPFRTLESFNSDLLTITQGGSVDGAAESIAKKRRMSQISTANDVFADALLDDRKEQQLEGSIEWSTYKKFFRAVHSNAYIVFVSVLFILSELAWRSSDYFLAEWVNWEERVAKNTNPSSSNDTSIENIDENVKRERIEFLYVYAGILVSFLAVYLFRAVSFYRMCLRISVNLHDMIFRGVTRTKMIFFNNNPSGRILNRFARDINNVDSLLPGAMFSVSDYFLKFCGIVLINAVVNPLFLIPAAVLTIFICLIRLIYINTGRSFKRIEALSRSSIYSHVNATLQGVATVRACNASKMLEKEFHVFQDRNTACFFLFNSASHWFAIWLDILSVLFSAFVTYSFLILTNTGIESGQIGLAILCNINLLGLCQYGILQSAEIENQMISVERLLEYAELRPEPPLESDLKNAPPDNWPQFGNIEFKSLSLRYAENGHRVLRNLTFRIDAKQKVGVVGRTGAGKSSIIQSLFRLAENEGQIIIDGIDIGVIGLHDLRKKISIIPQEPILFSGSMRFNLDPFGERSDTELWTALDQVELRAAVSAMPGGLDGKVLDGGSNFSLGQRQLLCLARAILRNNKILILDEATANVDSETDNLIQQTIRRQFVECTVITIAHRLNTVMDSDAVLVIDAGEIVEYDHPFQLIKADGFFKQLLDQTGDSTATALTLVAKENYDRRRTKS